MSDVVMWESGSPGGWWGGEWATPQSGGLVGIDTSSVIGNGQGFAPCCYWIKSSLSGN